MNLIMNKIFVDFSKHINYPLALCLSFAFFSIPTLSQIKKTVKTNEKAAVAVPRIERGECAVAVPPDGKTECAYLVAYEDQKAKRGRTIRLPFIIMKSDSAAPLPDPILYTGGGPGISSVGLANGRKYIPFLKNRDFILFEQRGTKYSQSNLECPEINDTLLATVKGNLTAGDSAKEELKAVRVCRGRLERSGINLSAYNSAASAADVEDLRRLSGYKKWNLYGISYSTRLMLSVMRYYPDGVRSVLLDSVLPPSVNYDETSVDGVMRSLNLVFSACKAQAECNAVYPDLEKQFYSLVAKLDAKPASVSIKDSQTGAATTLLLNGSDIVNGIYSALEDGYRLASLPSLISSAARNDTKALTILAETKIGVSSFAWGMRYSVWCAEEMPFQNRRLINNQFTSAYPK